MTPGRRTILTTIAALAAGCVDVADRVSIEHRAACRTIHELAQTIWELKEDGIKRDRIEMVVKRHEDDAEAKSIALEIVKSAYTNVSPLQNLRQMKSAEEFARRWETV